MSRRRLYFLASCAQCGEPAATFPVAAERDEWARRHRSATGHTVVLLGEWRTEGDPQRTLPPDPEVPTQPAELLAQAGPETVTLLCVGGPAHGRQVQLGAGDESWFDLASAQTYYRLWFTSGTPSPLTGRPEMLWRRHALVWEGIPTPQHAIAQLANWLYGQWVQDGGEQVPAAEMAQPPTDPSSNGGKRNV